tara:strand:- start:10335 stop:10787 length:453 start_codon:yes stop_codon:yes gene_type:complete
MKSISINRKANSDYEFETKIEAGLVLTGSEVKSLRNNSASIKESYIGEKRSELWLFNFHIGKYQSSSNDKYDPMRIRKILLSKKEQNKVIGSTTKKGFSIIPLSLYFNKKGYAKILIGIGRGKKKFDKRQTIKKKEWDIQKRRLLKNSQR